MLAKTYDQNNIAVKTSYKRDDNSRMRNGPGKCLRRFIQPMPTFKKIYIKRQGIIKQVL